jgi:hypothetical protein
MRELEAAERGRVAPLFDDHRDFPVLAESVLEGSAGTVIVDDLDSPRCAGLLLDHYAAFAGDVTGPGAVELMSSIAHLDRGMVIADSDWRELGRSLLGSPTTAERHSFHSSSLSKPRLRALRDAVDDGVEISPVDGDIARKMVADVSPDLIGVFGSPGEFVRGGFGYCALIDGKVASGATSALVSSSGVEIQITTATEFRGRGLAAAVSAAMILHCLEAGLEPHWSTSNPVSFRLAERLGYVVAGKYKCLSFEGAAAGD